MPPTIDLEPYRETIQNWLQEVGLSNEQIRTKLQEQGVRVGRSTLCTALKAWKIRSYTNTSPISQEMVLRVQQLFREEKLSDKEMKAVLEAEGFNVGQRTLQQLRLNLGLKKKYSKAEQPQHNEEMRAVLLREYQTTTLANLGRNHLYSHLRIHHPEIVGRDRMLKLARQIDPEGFARRAKKQSNKRIHVRPSEGPDHVWSIDAHTKLEYWGIQMYGCIDAWSRHVIWLFVGVSGRSAVSVMAQYLRAVREAGTLPRIITSDRGAETTMAADCHYHLSSLVRQEEGPLGFSDCFRYGTSKQNQRIEGYWSKLTQAVIHEWKNWFQELTDNNEYVKDSLADRVSFLAIYMPIVRSEIAKFRLLSSKTRIRNQTGKVVGVRSVLYKHPQLHGGTRMGLQVPEAELTRLQTGVQGVDLESFLPPDTLAWCQITLRNAGFPAQISAEQVNEESGERLHPIAYRFLRSAAARHIWSGALPRLHEVDKPLGARDWQPREDFAAAYQAAGQPLDMQEHPEAEPIRFV